MRLRRTTRLDEYFFAETPEVLNHAWGFPELRAFTGHLRYEMAFSCAGSSIDQTFHSMNVSRLFSRSLNQCFPTSFCSQAIMMGRHPRLRLGGNAEMPSVERIQVMKKMLAAVLRGVDQFQIEEYSDTGTWAR